jgi:dTMP kinase
MFSKFIAFYGINNIGKSTQALRLEKYLNETGYKVCYIKFPVYEITPSGEYINSILRPTDENCRQTISEEELQMWFAINRYQFVEKLNEKIATHDFVIAEDYVGTGIAWGHTKGLEIEWLEALNKYLPREDLAVFMHGTRGMDAKEERHIHEFDDQLVERCAEVHEKLALKYGWSKVEVSENWDITQQRIWAIISDKFGI